MSSNREALLDFFKTMLKNITVAHGFDNTVTNVVRKMVAYDDSTISFPILMVLGGGEVYEDELSKYTKSTLSIKIRGYIKDDIDPETALNSLVKDVLSILENSSYNTYKSKYRPIRLDTDEGFLNLEVNGVALFELLIEIQYRFDRNNP